MKKILWVRNNKTGGVIAKIGNVSLYCDPTFNSTLFELPRTKWKWICSVAIGTNVWWRGCDVRTTLAEAKKDAVDDARALLVDYCVSVLKEMKHFDCEVDDDS